MAEISPLRRRMIDDMTIRNLSPATQQSYIYAVAKSSAGILVVRRTGSA
jgi:integrase/recombinase XerD